ncbi:MAG: efflux transporter outer membrane subunit [Rhizobiales bacterium]|nr:efflux transporter outer membrane subunit [Rhizobacter sp.]
MTDALHQRTRGPALFVSALILSGCAAVGPNYQPPVVAVDAAFVNTGQPAAVSQATSADIATFWRGFDDPALTELVERALAANHDVRLASERLQESRANLLGAEAELLPNIGLSGGVNRSRAPEYTVPGTTAGQRTATVYDAGFTASWELDFFGRNRRASESAAAQVDVSAAGIQAAHTAVSAETARNYLELRGLQQRYEVAQESLKNQRDALRITSARVDLGRGTRLDVVRAQSLVDSTEATLPALQAAIDRTSYRLATLTAQPLRDLAGRLATPRPLPALPATDLGLLPLGTPEQLLRRRADLRQAERQLASATAEIGVATADLFPRVSLSGLLGLATTRFDSLGDSGSRQYAFGAAISWPLLDFGRVRSRISASESRARQALTSYEQTIAIALEETEGALSLFTRSAQQSERLASAARNAQEATRLARARFDAGVVDFLIVLDAERETLAARDALVQSQVSQATSLVGIYRALGGGWSPTDTAGQAAR